MEFGVLGRDAQEGVLEGDWDQIVHEQFTYHCFRNSCDTTLG